MIVPPLFFFSCSGHHRALHSFPTRRSSDLPLLITMKKVSAALAAGNSIVIKPSELGPAVPGELVTLLEEAGDRKSTRLNSSHVEISYAVFCLKKKKTQTAHPGDSPFHLYSS